MIRIILVGHGKMGRMIETIVAASEDMELIGVVDKGLFECPQEIPGRADVLIDFSYPGNLDKVLDYGAHYGCPLVIGTTGYSGDQLARIRSAAKGNAIVHSANYSFGVAALVQALKRVAPMLLDSFDVEIVETHHRGKADAPSGTAILLADAIDPGHQHPRVNGREGMTGTRGHEIGLHAVRGGSVAGEHKVLFFGDDETVELRHSAASRKIFANGALRAARFVCGKPAGLYTMQDILNEVMA